MTISSKTYELVQKNKLFNILLWQNFLRFRKASAPLRMLPDFIIVGAPRCGTSSLFWNLTQHPSVLSPLSQELHFFSKNFQSGVSWYQANFPLVLNQALRFNFSQRLITGEATSGYFFYPHIPQKILSIKPDVKIIVLLRDPVERAYLHHRRATSQRTETLSFEAAIEQEAVRIEPELSRMAAEEDYYSEVYARKAYLHKGLYAHHLKPWLAAFPKDQIHIIKSEDFFNNPAPAYREVLKFLNLPHWEPEDYRMFGPFVPVSMAAATQARLMEYFKPHNQELSQLLGHDFNWPHVTTEEPIAVS